ncbi:MAG: GC-type dockerin domain-anchored protein [Phycisphaerales bacterium]
MHSYTAAALATTLVAGSAATAQQIYSNGGFATGAALSNGAPAPAGAQWSELQVGNNTLGFVGPRYADNVTLAGSTQVQSIDVFAYVSNWPGGPSPFTTATLQVWNGNPGQTGSAVIFGNTVTNRFVSATLQDVYRAHNALPELTRRVWAVRIAVNTTLEAGEYWFDWGLAGVGNVVPVTLVGQLQKPGANAVYIPPAVGFWRNVVDGTSQLAQDFPFVLNGSGGTGGGCYPNCDQSTTPPVLNVQDFGCYLTRYAAGNAYANCDQSTTPPVLNVQDFGCFLTKYAAGCP